MKNKAIIMSFLLILLITISVSAISAADISTDDQDISSDDGIITEEISKDANDKSLSEGGLIISNNWNLKPSSDGESDAAAIQKCIDNSAGSGDTILLNNYNYTFEKTVRLTKDLTINGGTIYNTNNLSNLFTVVPKSEGGPNSITITGTTFYVNGNENIVLVKGENISSDNIINMANIKISNCKVIPIYQDIDSDISGTVLLNIESDRTLGASTGNITLSQNFLNDAIALKNNDYTKNMSEIDVLIVKAQKIRLNTTIVTKDMSIKAYDKNSEEPQTLEILLKDEDGNLLKNKTLSVGKNGEQAAYTTDENGSIKIPLKLSQGTYMYAMAFLGDDDHIGTMNVATVNVALKTAAITAKTYTYNVNAKTKKISITVKDQNNKLVVNKAIKITVNGKTYSGKTNAKGVATVTVSISKKGTYTYTAKVTGNSVYKEVTKKGKLVINGLSSALTLKKYSFKRYATKKIKVTLKSGKTLLKYKKITLRVNGKTYSAKTNSKGVATITIKLTKRGTFTYTAKFAGDNTYKATSKSNKVVIK